MNTTTPSTPPDRVACEICLKEVPVSESTSAEAADYFVHFCGLACFDKWKSLGGKTEDSGKAPDR